MREDLEIFENRSDDWLAKQRLSEEKVSVWDFDEARKIKEEHHTIHEAYNERRKQAEELRKQIKTIPPNIEVRKLSLLGLIISFIIIFLVFILSMWY